MAIDKSILIWEYLRPVLEASSDLTSYVNKDNIFQLAALEGTPYPFVILRRDSVIPQYSKHLPGLTGVINTISLSVSVWSDNYNESIYIANIVRSLLENYSYENDDIKIYHIELSSVNEYFNNNAFEQRLTFNVTVE
jgi:hypothetical protein